MSVYIVRCRRSRVVALWRKEPNISHRRDYILQTLTKDWEKAQDKQDPLARPPWSPRSEGGMVRAQCVVGYGEFYMWKSKGWGEVGAWWVRAAVVGTKLL